MEVNRDPEEDPEGDTEEVIAEEQMAIFCVKLKKWTLKKILMTLFFGQVLSLLLCGTSITSGLLSANNVTIPTAQSLANYGLLSSVYLPWLAFRKTDSDGILTVLKQRGWKYFLLAIVDVEGNFLMVKAYHYTSVTSVQLLDCFTIPVVLLLSWLILKVRYKLVHILGVFICLIGVGGLIFADVLTSNNGDDHYHGVVGDLMVLGGAVMYAISNVGEEFVVKKFDMVEFLAMIGSFGLIVNGIQLAILERDEIAHVDFTSTEIVLLLVGFALCLFSYYSLMPVMMKLTSAAIVNLSILSADFYALLVGLFLFKYSFHPLYFVAFVFIIGGVVVFCTKETPQSERQIVMDIESESVPERRAPSCPTPSCLLANVEEDEEIDLNTGSREVDEQTPLRT